MLFMLVKLRAALNIALFVALVAFIGLEVWTLVAHFLSARA